MRYALPFLALAVAVGLPLFRYLDGHTTWHYYGVWLAAVSAATFVVYGVDKLSAKIGLGERAPEALLDFLALLGGFAGGWAGMLVFHHKKNLGKHPSIWLFLVLSTLGHAALAYHIFA